MLVFSVKNAEIPDNFHQMYKFVNFRQLFYSKILKIEVWKCENVWRNLAEFLISDRFSDLIQKVQMRVNLVDLVKSFPTSPSSQPLFRTRSLFRRPCTRKNRRRYSWERALQVHSQCSQLCCLWWFQQPRFLLICNYFPSRNEKHGTRGRSASRFRLRRYRVAS